MSIKILAIFLIIFLLVLNILDAPEYIHCIHIGICEFLELKAHLEPDVKWNVLYTAKNNFFLMLENLTNSKELIQYLNIFFLPAILKSFKISCSHVKRQNRFLEKSDHPFPLIENNLTAQILKIVEISIILS